MPKLLRSPRCLLAVHYMLSNTGNALSRVMAPESEYLTLGNTTQVSKSGFLYNLDSIIYKCPIISHLRSMLLGGNVHFRCTGVNGNRVCIKIENQETVTFRV